MMLFLAILSKLGDENVSISLIAFDNWEFEATEKNGTHGYIEGYSFDKKKNLNGRIWYFLGNHITIIHCSVSFR